uniref:Uncharacterized protein n=1 Tax=Romanomermis culicivorax TaxID=13658 RepID=A0A915KIV2_ROMCU
MPIPPKHFNIWPKNAKIAFKLGTWENEGCLQFSLCYITKQHEAFLMDKFKITFTIKEQLGHVAASSPDSNCSFVISNRSPHGQGTLENESFHVSFPRQK